MRFADYAREVTLIVRGDSLEKSMSRYLIEQLRGKSNMAVQPRSDAQAVYGDSHLTAIDIRDNATRTAGRHDCGGLFDFTGADAETNWPPTAIAGGERGSRTCRCGSECCRCPFRCGC